MAATDFINIEYLADRIAAKIRDIPQKRVLTLDEAAQYLGVTPEALRNKVYLGRIPTIRIDSRMRFDRSDLDRIIDESKSKGDSKGHAA
jgi:excisionase family DNA binding protein